MIEQLSDFLRGTVKKEAISWFLYKMNSSPATLPGH